MKDRIKVLVIDDSSVVRQTFAELFKSTSDIELSDVASNPYTAASRLKKKIPDVIILDIEMPRMDGLTFLKKLMSQYPTPVIICSSLTETDNKLALEATRLGAVEVIHKPKVGVKEYLEESLILIGDAVRAAAQTKPAKRKRSTPEPKEETHNRPVQTKYSADAVVPEKQSPPSNITTTQNSVVAGASTGGTQALEKIIESLPANSPGMIIVQHMPYGFTATFAERLNAISKLEVKEASNGDSVISGRVLIAPGNKHLTIERNGTRYQVKIADGPLVSRHRPSIDVLFRSAAQCAGASCMGVLLTGMGEDGAQGLLEIKKARGRTLVQDEATSIVYGMPKAAVEINATENIVPLESISGYIARFK